MRPIFCRIGSKRRLAKKILRLLPPHRIYVEPFFGSGAVFWEKEPSEFNVVNDLNKKLVADYRRILKAPSDKNAYPHLRSVESVKRFLKKPNKTTAEKVTESILRRCSGFASTYLDTNEEEGAYKAPNTRSKTDKIDEYKDKLKRATIHSEDYRTILRDYDSPDTFFFLDPPYERSDKSFDYAEGEEFDFEELANALRKLKGKFLMTINDSPRIRQLFKGFKQKGYVVKGVSNAGSIGKDDRKELFILNY